MVKLLVLLLFLVGCNTTIGTGLEGDVYLKEGQDRAAAVVWREVFKQQDEFPVPRVRWVEGDALDCTDPNSGRPGFYIVGIKECREGQTVVAGQVQVAWRPGDRFSTTVMAHEFWHAALLRRYETDINHTGEAWKLWDTCPPDTRAPTGQCGVVDWANLRLEAEGL